MTQSAASRRQFLKTSAAAAAGLAVAPAFIPSTAFGANERIVTGHIGLGGQGRGNLGKFVKNAVAICDVDSKHAEQAAKIVKDKAGTECEIYGDYRKVLDRKDIDAVVISTPDHWHALPTIHACEAGKDVYCEKPLTLTIVEGRKIVDAARSNKRIVQTGSQQRSSSNFRKACELVRSGYIGKLQQVLVGIPGPNHPGKPDPVSDPPAELDFDFWLGPAPQRPYVKNHVHYNFRFFWDYSGGQMTNWGAHHIDIAHWGMGMDDSGPLSVDGEATFHPQGWHDVTETCRITYAYPNDVTMIVGQGQKDIPGGTTFIGEKGKIFVNRGKFTATPDEIGKIELTSSDVHLYDSNHHHNNFLDCIKSRELPICDAEIGHRTATACHLGNISCRLGRKIAWDAKGEKIVGDDSEASALVSRPYRSPWELT
ncbi:Gfo/Idh/MocA family oxidoreductase [Blastopirellula sp. J2-11]|uniref:Gfo/Idh/MocA family protein n=1 Tax=Blastopirellula sp. J2-11 TaxID=2943192 RepID=UPI0021C83173|nr:Gfo/Idh/MocA family oxidoreductase [Blastopirellula sp. J2-11]UUO09051.1 Gfo/Idh/MocA family oxidoreductase [Blastopirellula sp. J2-11]